MNNSKCDEIVVPVGVSARHVHLSRGDIDILFGSGYQLTKVKSLTQTGEYASNEKVNVVTKEGRVNNLRVLGPERAESQIELSKSDCRGLGINPPIRTSGDLDGSEPVLLEGPAGSVELTKGCIIANRHIHMSPKDIEKYKVVNNQQVSVFVGGEKGGIMHNVYIKEKSTYVLELHIDVDDANAFLLNTGDSVSAILGINE